MAAHTGGYSIREEPGKHGSKVDTASLGFGHNALREPLRGEEKAG